MKRLLRCSGIAIAGLVLVIIVAVIFAPDSEPSTSQTSPPTAAPTLEPEPTQPPAPTQAPTQATGHVDYPLERGGLVTVPGGIAFMDGRDLEADPPLTVMRINIWENPEPNRGKVVCKRRHGDWVIVIDVHQHEGQLFFKIEDTGCTGWVWQFFLSGDRHEPIGELIQ